VARFKLTVASRLPVLEYAPEPPFDSGRPERARPEIVAAAQKRLDVIRAERSAAVHRSAELLAKGG
jgi:cyclohexyl-isocyanide hydratase